MVNPYCNGKWKYCILCSLYDRISINVPLKEYSTLDLGTDQRLNLVCTLARAKFSECLKLTDQLFLKVFSCHASFFQNII